MVAKDDVINYCNDLLDISQFNDYCPNGLQVDGTQEVKKLVTGVTASQALIEAAVEANADMLLVHHGFFWKGESEVMTGMKYQRIKQLINADISLVGYHLPLDAHPTLGNNAQLAQILDLEIEGRFGGQGSAAIAMYGSLNSPTSASNFAEIIGQSLNRSTLQISPHAQENATIQTIAWCTGAAQSYLEKAAKLGVDAFITGEASEQTAHIARECGIHFFAAGHHATERYGVKALGEHLAQHFELNQQFIDIDNPI